MNEVFQQIEESLASFIFKEHGPGGFLLPTRLSVSMGLRRKDEGNKACSGNQDPCSRTF